ncbi:SAF domain-containing protein [Rhodococcus gannanensis]|uniref:SAF domain-containing protein n=1 Tax=Rhodococcus gannanensis TaxID=1960308 RepID=A0ABW4NYK7_9NOCA
MPRDAGRFRDALSPTALDRVARLTRPDWSRSTTGRRVAAAVLAAVALLLAVRGDPDDDRVEVVTAARDLAPGTLLGDEDLHVTALPAAVVPAGVVHSPGDVVGRTLAGPARSGEPLTDVRVLGSRLADAAAGPDARIVPLRIDDTEVAGLLRAGDVVDILTVDAEGSGAPRVLASNATVVLAAARDTGRTAGEPAVLVALPQVSATEVAAATMTGAITVTLH